MFAKPGHHLLPPERIDEWQRRGSLPFFHYAYDEERMLSYSFYEDSLQHDAFNAAFTQPTLIFQGLRDASVDYRTVEAFARARPNVTLSLARRRPSADREPAADLGRASPISWDSSIEGPFSYQDFFVSSCLRGGFCCCGCEPSPRTGLDRRSADHPACSGRGSTSHRPGETRRRLHRRHAAARDLRRARARGRSDARQPAGGARGAGDHDPDVRARESWPPSRRRIRLSAIRRIARSCGPRPPATERAAQATAGRILLSGDAIAVVYYSASCGGRTEIPSAVWPGADDPPYLPSRDRRCVRRRAGVDRASCRKTISLRALRAGGFRGDRLRDVRIASRNGSGRVARLRLDGLQPDQISGQDLRVVGRPHAGLAAHQEHGVRSAQTGRRVSLQRSRVGTRRRHVRHRIGAARRGRQGRRLHPGPLFPRPQDIGCGRRGGAEGSEQGARRRSGTAGVHGQGRPARRRTEQGPRRARRSSEATIIWVALPDDDDGRAETIAAQTLQSARRAGADARRRAARARDAAIPSDHRRLRACDRPGVVHVGRAS